MTSANYGIDWATSTTGYPDLDPYGRTSDGVALIREAIARRVTSNTGSLFGDPLYGFDLQSQLSASGPQQSIAGSIAAKLRAQILADERVETATVTQSRYDAVNKSLTLSMQIVTGLGPFDLVFDLTPSGIQLVTGGTS